MRSQRVEFRLIVKKADGSEYGGKIVYRRGTAAKRLLDYEKDGMAARFECWSNETGEWTHLPTSDKKNSLWDGVAIPDNKEMKSLAQSIKRVRCVTCGRKRPTDAAGFCKSCRQASLAAEQAKVVKDIETILTGEPAIAEKMEARKAVVITPRGKKMSAKQYIALVHAQSVRGFSWDCKDGHLECAAWLGGPCSAELLSEEGSTSTRGSVHKGCGGTWEAPEPSLEAGMPGLIDRCSKCGEERA